MSSRHLDAKPCGAEYSGPSGAKNDRLSRRTAMSPSSHTIGNTMNTVSSAVMERLRDDFDAREELLRQVVGRPPGRRVRPRRFPTTWSRPTTSPSGLRRSSTPSRRSATTRPAESRTRPGARCWSNARRSRRASTRSTASGRIGLLHVAFPLKMMRHPDGHVTSCDLLHTVAGAVIFDVYENQDARLIALQIPDEVLATFPGPAYGPIGIRQQDRLRTRPAGVRHDPQADGRDHARRRRAAGRRGRRQPASDVHQGRRRPLSRPRLLAGRRADQARDRGDRAGPRSAGRAGPGLLARTSPAAPNRSSTLVHAVVEAGASGVMFSETYAGGTVRMVREATRHLANPPAIYGHNAGIGVKTRSIWREVIDFLARLDGIDFRQTAPVRPGSPFIRPYGARVASLRRRPHAAAPGHQPHHDHPRRRTRPGEHHPQPRRTSNRQGNRPERALPGRLGDQLDQGQSGQDRPADRAGGAAFRRSRFIASGELEGHADRGTSRGPGGARRAART